MSIEIRLATAVDAPQIQAIYAPIVQETAISFELDVPSVGEIAGRIHKSLAQFPWLVCVDGNSVMGYAYAGLHRSRRAYQWSCEVSAYTHAEYRRRGVARGLYEAVFAILVLQGYFNAYAGIVQPNEASVGFHRALGFTLIGTYAEIGYKHGRWSDVAWYQKRLQPLVDNPVAPQPVTAVMDSEAFDAALTQAVAYVR